MKIATTTGDFLRYCRTDEERIRELHRAGFRNIDLNMYHWTPTNAYMTDAWRDAVQSLRALADELGMTFVQAHSQEGNPFSDDPAHVAFLTAATLRSIEVCAMLDIPRTVVHCGLAPGLTKEEWFARNRAFYRTLLPTAERFGVEILCENSTKRNMGECYYINSGRDMREFIDYVGHPLFHGCWDTGHANCEGPQYDEIMALGEELHAIHYNDNHGCGDEHVAPYMGTLNHDEVLHALIDVGYRGYFTLECDSPLRPYHYWQGDRRPYDRDTRLSEPPLILRRHIENMMYEAAVWMLDTYGLLER